MDFLEDDVLDRYTLPDNELEQIRIKASQYFSDAGVNNLIFTSEKPANPDVTVYFQGYRGCIEGVALDGVDQYDEVKTGERVVMFANTPQFYIPADAARDMAHEIGHTFGLSHILPTESQDEFRASIMDDRYPGRCPSCVDDRFLNDRISMKTVLFDDRHNPTYHLRRFVGGESDQALQEVGVCPGEYDLTFRDRLPVRIRILIDWVTSSTSEAGAKNVPPLPEALYDLRIVVDRGIHGLETILFLETISTAEPLSLQFSADMGLNFQLFASTIDGGEPDVLLGGESGPSIPAGLFAARLGPESLRLFHSAQDDTLTELAATTVEGFSQVIFRDGLEASNAGRIVQRQSSSTAFPSVKTIQPCIETQLIGIGYNSVTMQNFTQLITPETGEAQLLNNFTFDSGAFSPSSFLIDPGRSSFFAISSNPTLYEFALDNGEIINTESVSASLQAVGLASSGRFIGIGYNSDTMVNYVASLDADSGQVTVLNNFTFDSGSYFPNTLSVDQVTGVMYVVSSGPTLYAIDATTGQIMNTSPLAVSPSVMDVKIDGNLVGIGYNATTMQNYIVEINSITGATTVLNSFVFDSGGFFPTTFVLDQLKNRAFVQSSFGTLYSFDGDTGEILAEEILARNYSAFVVTVR